MDDALVQLVWQRAQAACEYCRLPQAYSTLTFEVDHITAKKHGGKTVPGNLALTCFYCNSYKGPNGADVLRASGTAYPPAGRSGRTAAQADGAAGRSASGQGPGPPGQLAR
jgi:hypothetical protein